MRARRKHDPIDVTPPMPKGETEFEERHMAADFILVYKRVNEVFWTNLKNPFEYAYRAGYVAGKMYEQRRKEPNP